MLILLNNFNLGCLIHQYILFLFYTDKRPAFSCYRTSSHNSIGTVTYHGKYKKYCDLSVIGITALHLTNLPGCHMTSKGMDPSSGIFTAHEGGVYQISFTGLFHAENGHGVTADVVKKHANGDITHLGRSTADIDENSFICKVFPKTFKPPF